MSEITDLQDRVRVLEDVVTALLQRIPGSVAEDLALAIVIDVRETPYRDKPNAVAEKRHPGKMQDRSERVRGFFLQEGLLDAR